jgi:hypothetical protein
VVGKEVILDTVKRMREGGIDDETILSTLKDIGVSDSDAEEYLNEKTGSDEVRVVEEEPDPHEKVLSKAAEKVKKYFDEDKETRNLHAAHQQVSLEGQGQKLDELHEKIDSFKEKHASSEGLSIELKAKLGVFEEKLSRVEKDVVETKAGVSALNSLLQKVLSTNRDILLELQQKKK